MKKIFAFLIGSIALTMSLPTLASVSNVFVSNTGDKTLSLIQCVTSNGENPIKCKEKERMEVGFGTSWPANQHDGHPAWWWSGLSGEVIGVKAKASLSPLNQQGNIVKVNTYNVPGGPSSGSNFIGTARLSVPSSPASRCLIWTRAHRQRRLAVRPGPATRPLHRTGVSSWNRTSAGSP